MSSCCSGPCNTRATPPAHRYRKVLWAALAINAAMFGIELGASVNVGSVSLLADSADFLGDAANYGVSLFVLGMAPVWRARAAYGKALVMGVFGVLALAANGAVAAMLYAFRDGDANMRSVWLCTRNDMIGNLAVLLAALGVFGTRAGWPDIVVAAIMALLGLSAARDVLARARSELRVVAAQGAQAARAPASGTSAAYPGTRR